MSGCRLVVAIMPSFRADSDPDRFVGRALQFLVQPMRRVVTVIVRCDTMSARKSVVATTRLFGADTEPDRFVAKVFQSLGQLDLEITRCTVAAHEPNLPWRQSNPGSLCHCGTRGSRTSWRAGLVRRRGDRRSVDRKRHDPITGRRS